jgi:putative CocE/NonD family hydrolase
VGLFTRFFERWVALPPATTRVAGRARDVAIPADDGTALLTDMWWPSGDAPAPTLLVRSPYGRAGLFGALFGPTFARRGMRVLVQSCRGTFGSGGRFRPQFDDRADGLATIRWIEEQPWFDGRLAMTGPSYLGYVQWAVADAAGESLRLLCPHITMSNLAAHWYRGGSFALDDALGWSCMVATQEQRGAAFRRLFRLHERSVARHIDALPLASLDQRIVGRRVDCWHEFLEHASADDPFWRDADHSARVARVEARVTMVTGWYDIFLPIQLADWRALAAAGRPPHLLIGPWTHTQPAGFAAQLRETTAALRAHLFGEAGALRKDPVRVQLMGSDEWRDFASWPPAGFEPRPWHLHAGGRLSPAPPEPSAPDRYRYDPAHPTPIAGGTLLDSRQAGRRDQANVEARDDVLTYTSDPLAADLDVIGEVSARVFVSSSLDWFDVFVRLCDVDAQGRSTNVCDGIQRVEARGRRDAGGAVAVDVALCPTAQRFRAGHRIRVQVASGAHPRFVRNLGTGEPIATATAMRVAEQAVHHDPAHPSFVSLPVAVARV